MNDNLIYSAGDIFICRKFQGLVTHYGVPIGLDAVVQNTPGKGEHLSTIHGFSAGQPITVLRTGADVAAVLWRAQNILENPKSYDLLFRNCQHTAYEIVYGVAKSPMVNQWATCAIVAGVLVVLLPRRQ